MRDRIRELAREVGFDACGFAEATPPKTLDAYDEWLAAGRHGEMDYLRRHRDAKSDLNHLLPGVKTVIAVALNYHQTNPWRPGYPKVAQYALGRDYHKVIPAKLRKIAAHLPGRWRICTDAQPLLEREYAHRAGLGWFGKNTMLIDSRRGSWFLLGFLLTDQAFEPDAPSLGSCGSCRACIDACPTGALIFAKGRWQVDARRCISYLTIEAKSGASPELAPQIGDWTFGCDVCQEVCPFNQPRERQPSRAAVTAETDFLEHHPLVSVPLRELAELGETAWHEMSKGSPLRRSGLHGIKRNSFVNLLNNTAPPPRGPTYIVSAMEQLMAMMKEKTGMDDAMAEKVMEFLKEHMNELPKMLGGGMMGNVRENLPGGMGEMMGNMMGGDDKPADNA